MSKLTKQGLEQSLYACLEFGYRACERGENIQAARSGAASLIGDLVAKADNCPLEIMRISIAHSGKLPEVDWKRKGNKRASKT